MPVGQMSDADSGIRFVYMLATGAGRSVGVDLQIRFIYLNVHVVVRGSDTRTPRQMTYVFGHSRRREKS